VPNKGDTAWMMVATLLVILMTVPGLALFYGGLVRSKNMLSVLMQVMVTFSLIVVLWASTATAWRSPRATPSSAASTGCS
jgi:Amt family ammonium transporter